MCGSTASTASADGGRISRLGCLPFVNSRQSPKTPPKRPTDRLIGAQLAGKYRILQKIGAGGMGAVYTAVQDPIDRQVAIKVLLRTLAGDEVAVRRFEQEARAISRMQHPHTVTIYDFGRTDSDGDERLYIVMEHLKGETLAQVLRADGVLVPPRACRIMRQVCASLADAHAAGIIHRDLKPDNVFLTEVGGDKDWVKVLDFGVAKLVDSKGAGALTQTGMIFGTPKYMSPEQAEGRPIDHRADIYAIGVVLYELLVGRPPFVADTPVGLLLKHIAEPPPPFADIRPGVAVDRRLESIVMRALAKSPEDRPQTAVEFGRALEAFERRPTGLSLEVARGASRDPVRESPTEMDPGTVPGPLTSPRSPARPAAAFPGGTPGAPVASGDRKAEGPRVPVADDPSGPGHAPAMDLGGAGLTQPAPMVGGGVETLGGSALAQAHRSGAGPLPYRPGFRFAGIGLLGVAAVLAGLLAVRGHEPRGGTVAGSVSPGEADHPPGGRYEPAPVLPDRAGRADPAEAGAPAAEAGGPAAEAGAPAAEAGAPAAEAGAPAAEHGESGESSPPQRAHPRRMSRGRGPTFAPPARTVTLRFESEPHKAMVRLDGKQLGLTPFEKTFARGDDILVFSFEKDGFVEKTRAVSPEHDRTLRVILPQGAVGRENADRKKPKRRDARPTRARRGSSDADPTQERVGDLKGF